MTVSSFSLIMVEQPPTRMGHTSVVYKGRVHTSVVYKGRVYTSVVYMGRVHTSVVHTSVVHKGRLKPLGRSLVLLCIRRQSNDAYSISSIRSDINEVQIVATALLRIHFPTARRYQELSPANQVYAADCLP